MNTLLVRKTKRPSHFQCFRHIAQFKFQCPSEGKTFKITRPDLFVNFLNNLLLEKIASRRGINSRTLDYREKFPNSSLYWKLTLARDSAYVKVQFAAILGLKLCFKKSYTMYYYLSLARFFGVGIRKNL